MFHRVVSPGLELRQFQFEDAEEIFAAADRNRAYLREWLPWVDHTHSAADVRTFIEAALEQHDAGLGPNCAIVLDGKIVGSIGSHRFNMADRNCSIGYWIDAASQGKGIVTQCSATLLDYLFGEVGMHRVEIRCGTGNERSCAVPERLGFTREGVLREAEWVSGRWVDLVVWGMLEQEWKGLHRP
jgi:ribosomal-protein-serine acetyltransferase